VPQVSPLSEPRQLVCSQQEASKSPSPERQPSVAVIVDRMALSCPSIQVGVSLASHGASHVEFRTFDPFSYGKHERKPYMSNTGIIGTYVAIFVFIGSAFGALEHASKTDPSYVERAHVAVHGIAIPPFRN
jgi:hypothetical protein